MQPRRGSPGLRRGSAAQTSLRSSRADPLSHRSRLHGGRRESPASAERRQPVTATAEVALATGRWRSPRKAHVLVWLWHSVG